MSLWIVAATSFMALSRFVGVGGDIIRRNVEYAFPFELVAGLETGLIVVSTMCYFGVLFQRSPGAPTQKTMTDRIGLSKRPWVFIVLALSIMPLMLSVFFFPARADWPAWLSIEIKGLIFAICVLFVVIGHLCLILVQLMRLNNVLLEDLEAGKT
jgi:hypothetical protein